MGSFLSAIFGGSNPTLDKTINNAGATQGFTMGAGERGTTDAMKYYHDILSGNTSALAPEISAGQDEAQQQKGNLAEFGTRSGGTTGASVAADAANRANIINMLAKLRSGAAGAEGQLGTVNTNLSLDANNQEASQSQQRLKNLIESILGKGIGAAVGGAESLGLGNWAKSLGLGQ